MLGKSSCLAALAARLASGNSASSSAPTIWRGISTTQFVAIRKYPVPVGRPAVLPFAREEAAEAEEGAKDPLQTSRALLQDPKVDLVQKVLGLELKSASEKMREKLAQTRLDFQRAEGDTGSPEVQVALLTKRITNMASHMNTHRKDFNSRRGLAGLLNRRRKLLQYLRRADFDAYTVLLVRLGLKDNYAKQDRLAVMQQKSSKRR